MAVTLTPILAGKDTYIVDVVVDAADLSSGNIAHGLGVIPKSVNITNKVATVATSAAWAASTIDITNVVITRHVTGASTADTVRVIIKTPHSIGA